MNRNIINYIKYLRKNFALALASLLFVGSVAVSMPTQAATSINTVRDCDANAVVYCGATTTKELTNKYDSNASARAIYSHFGITKQDVHNMSKTAKAGRVTKNGDVYLNGKVVARSAVTAGRQYIPGSTKVTYKGVTFYKRHPKVSFVSNSLDAFIVMKDGQFDFAILAACGNPVSAKPTTKPKKPAPKKPAPEKPAPEKPVVPEVPTPEEPTPEEPTPEEPTPEEPIIPEEEPAPEEKVEVIEETPEALPNTGPANAIGLFLGSSSVGSLAYHFVIRRRLM